MNLMPAILQAIFAIIGLEILRRRVLRRLESLAHASLFINVWGPISLVLPLLGATRRVEMDGGATAWPVLGQAFMLMPMGLACGLLMGRARGEGVQALAAGADFTVEKQQWGDWACWVGAAAVFVLVTALGKLSMPVGQCGFALGAVLLWWRTPDVGPESENIETDAARTWNAISLVMLCAVGQGAAAYFCSEEPGQRASVLCESLYAALFLLLCGRSGSGQTAVRLGGWGMTVGGLMGLGVIAMVRFFPNAISTMKDPNAHVDMQVVYGLGRFTVEANAALACAAVVPVLLRWPVGLRRIFGAVILMAVFALEAWRITGISAVVIAH